MLALSCSLPPVIIKNKKGKRRHTTKYSLTQFSNFSQFNCNCPLEWAKVKWAKVEWAKIEWAKVEYKYANQKSIRDFLCTGNINVCHICHSPRDIQSQHLPDHYFDLQKGQGQMLIHKSKANT